MNAETMIKEYHNMKRELSMLEYQLQNFAGVDTNEVISAMSFYHPDGERVQTSSLSDKTAKVAMTYRKVAENMDHEWFSYLQKRYEENIDDISFFEYSITKLSGKMKFFIHDMVIEELSWSELMGKYNVSHSMIGKYRKKAVKELNDIYSFSEQQLEKYLLS